MITVKRKAKVGEKILITNAREHCLEIHGYDNGDKFIVRNRSDYSAGDPGVIVDDNTVYKNDVLNFNNFFFVYDHEYEVIEDEN